MIEESQTQGFGDAYIEGFDSSAQLFDDFFHTSGPSTAYLSWLAADGRWHTGRSVEHYLRDGRLDTSRCHYTLDGRKVRRAVFHRALWGKKAGGRGDRTLEDLPAETAPGVTRDFLSVQNHA